MCETCDVSVPCIVQSQTNSGLRGGPSEKCGKNEYVSSRIEFCQERVALSPYERLNCIGYRKIE